MITPNSLHFERSHGGVPDIDPAQHKLAIHGLVKRPLVFTVEALSRYPMTSRISFIECGGNSGGLSTDGKWLGYTVTKSNRDSELRLQALADGKETVEPFGSQLTYTSDMKWAAWSVGYSTEQQDRSCCSVE